MDDFYFYVWEEVEEAVNTIVTELESFPDLKYVYGIPRGGVVLATMISYRTELEYLQTFQQAEANKSETLIVDDICDSGITLKMICKDHMYTTATMVNEDNPVFMPDIFVYQKKSRWEIFPWEDGDSEALGKIEFFK